MEKKLNILNVFVFSLLSLLLLYPGTLARENKEIHSELIQSRDHDAGSSSYQVPQQETNTDGGYGGPAPAKPAAMTVIQKFKFIAVLFVLVLMTLGMVWVFFRVTYYANVGAAGTTRSAVQSLWNGLSQSILQDVTLTDLTSTILNPQTIHGILETILESSK